MIDYQLGEIEAQFADIIWESQPISSSELARKSEEIFNWKKSTTYTVLKRLCNKGLFQNQKGIVIALVTKEDYYSAKSERFVESEFKGSLPAFLAAFTANKRLSAEEVAQLRKIVADYEEE